MTFRPRLMNVLINVFSILTSTGFSNCQHFIPLFTVLDQNNKIEIFSNLATMGQAAYILRGLL